jgi:anti-repressor protein
MTALTPFTYATTEVRTVLVDGEPWFVAADIAQVLGYSATAAMTRSLDDDEKGMQNLHTLGGEQQFTVISEPGLYEAILRSRVPQAQAFKRWVKHEVLPQIRRTGQFGSQLPANFAEALELAAVKVRALEAAEAKIASDAPKVEAYDAFMDAEGYYPMEAAARILGYGRNTFFRVLRDAGILQRGLNLPYRQFDHHFKVTTSYWTDGAGQEHATYTTRVLPSGIDYLRKRLDHSVREIAS